MKTRLFFICAVLALGVTSAGAQAPATSEAPDTTVSPITLDVAAAKADVIAVMQVRDTDYAYARDFPVGGTAFLAPLITYKTDRTLEDIVEVYEEGLHAYECYFPNPTVFEEGRRYLVFLSRSPEFDDQYNGLAEGCALEVLVTEDNRYALRFPLDGMALAADYGDYAAPMNFQDAYATVEEDAISPDKRNEWLAAGFLTGVEGGYRYTHGIPLSTARGLLGKDNLTLDRELR